MSAQRQSFESVNRSDVPTNRKGKHHDLVERILREVAHLKGDKALKIPRSEFGRAKLEHVRAALTRASTKTKLDLSTTADEDYFYVWRQPPER